MESADGRIMVLIIVGIALFIVGRRFQFMVMMWQAWKDTVAAVPVRKRTAFSAVKNLIKVAIIAAIIFWVAANINRFM
ncbi:hypothetical protein [Nonomuraea turcica]|uniref:hypothetical protein n=1 Tax=Nonomuraea sp. G32 TaxID=3067274 RepID=UPI00273BA0CF|nr:hypothetical protein [Nonomuraea sp. G32]MDP4501135.1 hypothetical protein [Nonomuraea sp. G32]